MIAGCPKCSARYRVDLEQIGDDGAKLRCTKCSAVFLVRAPQSVRAPAQPPPEATPAVDAPTKVTSEPPVPVPADMPSPPSPEPTADLDPSVLVLIADSSEERGKEMTSAIEGWGLSPILVHDGVEAMLAIQRNMPKVVVLDAALPKMFGFQVCEIVKRNESLCHMSVVLVGAIHHQDRYRRNPSDLYGADVYLEQPDLPDGLLPLLRDVGMPVPDGIEPEAPQELDAPEESAAPVESEEPRIVEAPPTAPEPTIETTPPPAPLDEELSFEPALESPSISEPVAEDPALAVPAPVVEEDPELGAERERAERLARIAVSEMLLYQPEKFDQAIRDKNIETVLDLEIQEARALIRQRISEEVRSEKDFILVELERVAEERSAAS
jgi:predicted Zn finger-like uncharacterized protein